MRLIRRDEWWLDNRISEILACVHRLRSDEVRNIDDSCVYDPIAVELWFMVSQSTMGSLSLRSHQRQAD